MVFSIFSEKTWFFGFFRKKPKKPPTLVSGGSESNALYDRIIGRKLNSVCITSLLSIKTLFYTGYCDISGDDVHISGGGDVHNAGYYYIPGDGKVHSGGYYNIPGGDNVHSGGGETIASYCNIPGGGEVHSGYYTPGGDDVHIPDSSDVHSGTDIAGGDNVHSGGGFLRRVLGAATAVHRACLPSAFPALHGMCAAPLPLLLLASHG